LRSESLGQSSAQDNSGSFGHTSAQHQSHQHSPSQAPNPNQDLGETQDDGQAEDLVSDVHLRAQQASQAAVVAGQEQQQNVLSCTLSHTSPCSHDSTDVRYVWVTCQGSDVACLWTAEVHCASIASILQQTLSNITLSILICACAA